MANLVDHMNQAEHNQELAEQLDQDQSLQHWDWLITISFYAAVHYVEAFLEGVPSIGHTETACKKNNLHAFRKKAVLKHLGRDCFRSYRDLLEASYAVRYLGRAIKHRKPGIATTYYTRQDASEMLNKDLKKIREAVEAKI
jgi:hypothetical protein